MKPLFTTIVLATLVGPAWPATRTVTLSVPGMNCAACPITVKKALTKVGGVQVDCRVLTPMTFSVDRAPPKGPDLDAYRASHPEACPGPPRLLTEVAGSLL